MTAQAHHDPPVSPPDHARPGGPALAILIARGGRLPGGTKDAVVRAGGEAVVVGERARQAAAHLPVPGRAWWLETGAGFRPAAMATQLAPVVGHVPLLVLPATPDGRDLAPRLAALLDRPLLAGAIELGIDMGDVVSGSATGTAGENERSDGDSWTDGGMRIRASLSRLDDRVLVPAATECPAVATLVPGPRETGTAAEAGAGVELFALAAAAGQDAGLPRVAEDAKLLRVLDADPATMDLDDARRVLGGGAGLVRSGDSPSVAASVFVLLADVAAALNASAGATRVATDAGWAPTNRQIGTTGVSIDPDLYVAFGVSGAAQHVGGLGAPRHIVSVNTDASCPMTAMASLGLVTDARALLIELAHRLGCAVPPELAGPDDG